jgi:hypothetical protein
MYSGTQEANIIEFYDMMTYQPILSAADMFQLDSKMDDGFPATGNIRDGQTADWGLPPPVDNPPCTTSSVTPIQYNLSPNTANILSCSYMDFLF